MQLRFAASLKRLHRLLAVLALLVAAQNVTAQDSAKTDTNTEAGAGNPSAASHPAPATNPPHSPPDTSGDTSGTHQNKLVIVADGDTLTSISRTEFGTPSLWRHIAEFNNINPADQLLANQVLLIPTLIATPRQFAIVVYTHGEAFLSENETESATTLQRNDRIFPGNIVETGRAGFASISFQNNSVVNLQPGSRFKLLHLGCLDSDASCFIDISVPQGELSLDVESRDNQPTHFRLKSLFASAAVRGTRFDISSSDDQLLLGVTEGLVAVQAANSEVDIEQGFGSITLPNQPPGGPIPLLHLPTYTNIPPRVAVGDRIGWWQVTDAATYKWIISNDASSTDVVAEATTAANFFEIDALTAGDYYLQVRAVDANGLKGFPNTEKFSLADIVDVGGPPIELRYTRTGREILIEVQEPDEQINGYEIQIASTQDFTDVISIDVGPSGQAYVSDMNRRMFLRARALVSPLEVSAFGPSLQTD